MDNLTTSMYKYDDIKYYFEYWLDNNDMTVKQAFEKYDYDLHHQVFNTDYFIIGYYQAETLVNHYAYWLGQEIVYEAIYKLEEE